MWYFSFFWLLAAGTRKQCLSRESHTASRSSDADRVCRSPPRVHTDDAMVLASRSRCELRRWSRSCLHVSSSRLTQGPNALLTIASDPTSGISPRSPRSHRPFLACFAVPPSPFLLLRSCLSRLSPLGSCPLARNSRSEYAHSLSFRSPGSPAPSRPYPRLLHQIPALRHAA